MRTYQLSIAGRSFTVVVRSLTAETSDLEVNGTRYQVRIDQVVSDTAAPLPARRAAMAAPGSPGGPAPAARPAAAAAEGAVPAPIPGLILEVFVRPGDTVAAGQAVVKMEAMKMETTISAPAAGTVDAVHVQAGNTVSQGQPLVTIG